MNIKKILTAAILLLQTSSSAFCANYTENLILQPTDTAMLFFDERPMNLEISNPNIVKARTISNIFADDSKVTVEALDFGTSNLIVKTKSNQYLYKIEVQKNPPKDTSMILDTPD